MNVCPIIPRTYTTPMEDLTLDVTVLGAGLHLTEIEVEACECRTLYIAGDSTVADQSADYPYLPGNSYSGWGQMIQAYLNPKMAVSNHSHSGLTTESFRSEGHYQILYDRIRKNDICLFQFGHNDQKLMHLMAEDGYRSNLIQYIQEIRSKGAVPVLVTPLARNSWKGKDNSYNDLLAPYANACIDIGKEHAGVVECAWQNGMIPDTMVSDHRFYPKKRITGEEFLILLMNGYQSRKTIQAETFGELPKEFQKNGYLKRRTAADICRNLSI